MKDTTANASQAELVSSTGLTLVKLVWHHDARNVQYPKMPIVLNLDVLEAAARVLDKESYKSLKISGEPKEYEQFYKDVSLLAETIAGMVVPK